MISAIAAGCASGIIDAVHAFLATNGVVCAGFEAFAAIRAEGFDKAHLRLPRKAFGVRTPLA